MFCAQLLLRTGCKGTRKGENCHSPKRLGCNESREWMCLRKHTKKREVNSKSIPTVKGWAKRQTARRERRRGKEE